MKKYLPLAVTTPLVLILDQWTKFLAVTHLTRLYGSMGQASFFGSNHLLGLRTPPVGVIADVWDFRYAENTGAAFSFLAGANDSLRVPFFYLVALLATALIGYFYVKSEPEHSLRRFALAMVLGGAFGNTLDRIVHGYVIDFIHWHAGPHEWPVFNVADSFVCVGVALLLCEGWLVKQTGKSLAAPKPQTS